MIVLFIISHETSMTLYLSTIEYKPQNNNNNKSLASTSQPLIHRKKRFHPKLSGARDQCQSTVTIIYIQIFHLLLRCTIRLSTGQSRPDLSQICWPLRSSPPSDMALISKIFVCIVNKIIINNIY